MTTILLHFFKYRQRYDSIDQWIIEGGSYCNKVLTLFQDKKTQKNFQTFQFDISQPCKCTIHYNTSFISVHRYSNFEQNYTIINLEFPP